jgi:hypothetical protein
VLNFDTSVASVKAFRFNTRQVWAQFALRLRRRRARGGGSGVFNRLSIRQHNCPSTLGGAQ